MRRVGSQQARLSDGPLFRPIDRPGRLGPAISARWRQTYQVLTRLKSLGVTLSSFALKVAGIPEDNAEHSWNGTYASARQSSSASAPQAVASEASRRRRFD